MQNVGYLIYVGDNADAAEVSGNPEWAVVHACKTAHKEELGYEKSLPQDHPSYLVHNPGSDSQEIFLNLVDMKAEFQPQYTDPILRAAFDFISTQVAAGKKVLIHCDQGNSRGPSVAMAFLARGGDFNNWPYTETKAAFTEIYPSYNPGEGVSKYLEKHWPRIMGF